MYFQFLDALHLIPAVLFVCVSLIIIFIRYKKYVSSHGKGINYFAYKNITLLRIISLGLSVIFIGTSILGPVGFMRDSAKTPLGIDCIWLLDVSASMDVLDIKESNPPVSRLEKAKSIIESYMIAHRENRYGLVIFAGKSRLVSPLTSEHGSILSFLASIDSKSISEGGTDFHEALTLATDRFDTKGNSESAIVLLSDGGDPDDYNNSDKIANILSGKNLHITTIGIGNKTPSPIPVGKNPFGDTVYKKYNQEIVLSSLNTKSLKSLAKIGNGEYVKDDESILKNIERALNSIGKTSNVEGTNTMDITQRIFIFIGFFCFLVFLLFPSTFLKSGNVL